MSTQKLSITVPEETLREIRRSAEEAGLSVSAWMSQAVELVLQTQAGLDFVAEYEETHGPLSPDSVSRAQAEIHDALARSHADSGAAEHLLEREAC
ncbi:hypothetical protein HDA32_001468 [Spinactinospora alkalitolerans]|uniref:Ribbon-helix-helix protein CopG domain-containing protein n=1 Tax=Spinactinospora alkalitolerans TaxID=687207 RepID=A0A852TQV8_9ACTN|nr:hypothetical protein [Spinactinospora alkalitolerans]NYE46348.1 hypothetical protein [Spinactinospora alkalitolerans]